MKDAQKTGWKIPVNPNQTINLEQHKPKMHDEFVIIRKVGDNFGVDMKVSELKDALKNGEYEIDPIPNSELYRRIVALEDKVFLLNRWMIAAQFSFIVVAITLVLIFKDLYLK